MPYVSSHGATFTWGTQAFQITSLQVNATSGNEIDITSMSSEVVADFGTPDHKMIVPDYDAVVSARYASDLSIEFYASIDLTAANYFDMIGRKRGFVVKFPGNDLGQGQGLAINKKAILTQMQLGATTGEYVKGSATFRVTGN
jgi:hypothetical protein